VIAGEVDHAAVRTTQVILSRLIALVCRVTFTSARRIYSNQSKGTPALLSAAWSTL